MNITEDMNETEKIKLEKNQIFIPKNLQLSDDLTYGVIIEKIDIDKKAILNISGRNYKITYKLPVKNGFKYILEEVK